MWDHQQEPLVLRQAREIALEIEVSSLPLLIREALNAAQRDDDRWATPAQLEPSPLGLISPNDGESSRWQERILAYTRACLLLGRPWPAVLDLLLIANRDTPRLRQLFFTYYGKQTETLTNWREACQYLRLLRKRLERQSNAV